jgi:thiol-disulfide isomerase/thioredoxin
VLVSFICIALTGCGQPTQELVVRGGPADTPQRPLPNYSTYTYQYPLSPPVLDAEGLQFFVKQFKDNVVLLHFWASWSPRSREDLARLAFAQSDFRDDGLRIVACTFDLPEDWTARTVPILQGAGANFPCVVIPRSARAALREWLSTDWNHDLPARFVLSPAGKPDEAFLSGTSVEAAVAKARRILDGERWITQASAVTPAGGTLRLRTKLINVASGEFESLPPSFSLNAGVEQLAEPIVSYVSARLDRTADKRIAVLPFPSSADRRQAGPLGKASARAIEEGLRGRGFSDLVEPAVTQQLVDDMQMDALSIDFDPSSVRGRLAADYLLIGWVEGEAPLVSPRPAVASTAEESELAE